MNELTAEDFRTIGPADAIPDGTVVPLYLADRKLRVAIACVDDRIYAFDDLCTCASDPCPLSGGLLTGTTILCQCHGSEFDVTTGTVLHGPAPWPLTVHDVEVVDGTIHIRA